MKTTTSLLHINRGYYGPYVNGIKSNMHVYIYIDTEKYLKTQKVNKSKGNHYEYYNLTCGK